MAALPSMRASLAPARRYGIGVLALVPGWGCRSCTSLEPGRDQKARHIRARRHPGRIRVLMLSCREYMVLVAAAHSAEILLLLRNFQREARTSPGCGRTRHAARQLALAPPEWRAIFHGVRATPGWRVRSHGLSGGACARQSFHWARWRRGPIG